MYQESKNTSLFTTSEKIHLLLIQTKEIISTVSCDKGTWVIRTDENLSSQATSSQSKDWYPGIRPLGLSDTGDTRISYHSLRNALFPTPPDC